MKGRHRNVVSQGCSRHPIPTARNAHITIGDLAFDEEQQLVVPVVHLIADLAPLGNRHQHELRMFPCPQRLPELLVLPGKVDHRKIELPGFRHETTSTELHGHDYGHATDPERRRTQHPVPQSFAMWHTAHRLPSCYFRVRCRRDCRRPCRELGEPRTRTRDAFR